METCAFTLESAFPAGAAPDIAASLDRLRNRDRLQPSRQVAFWYGSPSSYSFQRFLVKLRKFAQLLAQRFLFPSRCLF